nr:MULTISPECIES: hypothetical protein [unclassified Microcoleus]
MERCKSLVKNFERTLSHATAKLNLCLIGLMLKRLAHSYISNGFYRAILGSNRVHSLSNDSENRK